MKVYYFEFWDLHGVFSTEEKAIEYFNTLAKSERWTDIEITKMKGWTIIEYNYSDYFGKKYHDHATITEFTIDDLNN